MSIRIDEQDGKHNRQLDIINRMKIAANQRKRDEGTGNAGAFLAHIPLTQVSLFAKPEAGSNTKEA